MRSSRSLTLSGSVAGSIGQAEGTVVVEDQQLRVGRELGRYVLLSKLGEGGMGVVWKAHDRELARNVALKFISITAISGPDSVHATVSMREHLVAEARSLAQMDDPNVVAIFDVGTLDDRLYLAMELVEGQSLREWMDEHISAGVGIRSAGQWRPIVEIMAQAAAGLHAVHRIGFIHRDFKPGNLMVGEDQWVRLMDFGLAVRAHTSSASGQAVANEPVDGTSTMTGQGGVAGTPAYMSPEQRRGSRLTAASDQYSFCIVLHELLYGRRPARQVAAGGFQSMSGMSRLFSISRHLPAPTGPAEEEQLFGGNRYVPRWLERVIRRGLLANPDDRFASMQALRQELIDGPVRVHRRRRQVVSLIGATAVSTALVQQVAASFVDHCGRTLEVTSQAWSPTRLQGLAHAFEATGLAHAGDTWSRVARRLSDGTADWSERYLEQCRALEVAHTQGSSHQRTTIDHQLRCLDSERRTFMATLDQFAKVDAELVDKAVNAVAELKFGRDCGQGQAHMVDFPLPKAEVFRARAKAVEARFPEIEAAIAVGRTVEAGELLAKLYPEVAAIDHEPLLFQFLRFREIVRTISWDREGAAEDVERALEIATRHGWDHLAAELAVARIFILGYLLRQEAVLDQVIEDARVRVERTGNKPRAAADLYARMTAALDVNGRSMEAVDAAAQAVRISRDEFGVDEPGLVNLLNTQARSMTNAGLVAQATTRMADAIALARNLYGAEHPSLALLYTNYADALDMRGRSAESLQAAEQARRLTEGRGQSAGSLIWPRFRYAMSLERMGLFQRARDVHEQVMQVVEQVFATMTPEKFWHITELARATLGAGDHAATRQHLTLLENFIRSLVARGGQPGFPPGRIRQDLGRLGGLWLGLNEPERAEALVGLETRLPPMSNPQAIAPELELVRGRLALRRGDLAQVERALARLRTELERSAEGGVAHRLDTTALEVAQLRVLGRLEQAQQLAERWLEDGTSAYGRAGPPLWKMALLTAEIADERGHQTRVRELLALARDCLERGEYGPAADQRLQRAELRLLRG